MDFSACIEMLFVAETDVFADRIRLARQADLSAVEFWTWRDKDIAAVEAALQETGIRLAGFVAEPMIPLTDPANRGEFLAGLAKSAELARRLGAPVLIAQAGNELDSLSRAAQRDSLIQTLDEAGILLEGMGVRLGVEPLNTLIDHKGYFLDSSREALDIVDEVNRETIGIVYDVYHSAVMGERTNEAIVDRMDHVFHVHLADHPGHHQPGSGTTDLKQRLEWLVDHGYSGLIGLEFRPTGNTLDALRATERALA